MIYILDTSDGDNDLYNGVDPTMDLDLDDEDDELLESEYAHLVPKSKDMFVPETTAWGKNKRMFYSADTADLDVCI